MPMTEITRIDATSRPAKRRIVHLGLGAFHRAHQAVYLQKCLDGGDTNWGITSANLRSNSALVTGLAARDYRYHVAEYRDSETVTLREITAIDETLFSGRGAGRSGVPDDRDKLLDRIASPETRLVTLTVTEKGYCLVPASGELDASSTAIQSDLADPYQPHSGPGLLVEGLRRRRAADAGGVTILSCDNMPHNGPRTRSAVVGMARLIADAMDEPELPDWIATHVRFPASMVDRIVPAMTDAEHERLARLGVDDPNAVVCEAFSQWVVEDDFAVGRPDWERVGVEMVEDVTPFETMKLRMLNGAHSLVAYLGSLAGIKTVAEAIAREDITLLLRQYLRDEATPTLTMPNRFDLADYRESLLARFGNDSLAHSLHQIAADGSQKLPQRWLAGARQQIEGDGAIACVALGAAGWIRYTAGTNLDGQPHTVNDPMADRLAARHAKQGDNPDALIAAFLADRDIFDRRLAASEPFITAVSQAYRRLTKHGLAAAIAALPPN